MGNGLVVEHDGSIIPIQLPNGDKLPGLPHQHMNIIKYKSIQSKEADQTADTKNELKRIQTQKVLEANQLAAENIRLYKQELKQMKSNMLNSGSNLNIKQYIRAGEGIIW